MKYESFVVVKARNAGREFALDDLLCQRDFSFVEAAALVVLHGVNREVSDRGQDSRYVKGNDFKLRTFVAQCAPARMRCEFGRNAILDVLLGVGAFKKSRCYGWFTIHPQVLTDMRISRVSTPDANGRTRLTAYGIAQNAMRRLRSDSSEVFA